MTGRVGFEVALGTGRGTTDDVLRRSGARRILVLGDFSGRGNRGIEDASDLASRPILSVDLDRFDGVFARLSPCLRLQAGGEAAGGPLLLESLDDFHPDRLFATLDGLRPWRESRARLTEPASFEQEAARLMEGQATAAAPGEPATALAEDESGLLQRLIGSSSTSAASPPAAPSVVDGLIRRLVQPHIQAGPSRSPAPYLAAVDASLSAVMRAVLHDPGFQQLEAIWRGTRALVDSLELGDTVTLHVVDVSKRELMDDLAAHDGATSASAAWRLLVDTNRRGADARPWSLLVGHYSFGASADDVALLGHLGVIASHAGGPLLAAAEPSLLGCDSLSEDTEPRRWAIADGEVARRWHELRRSPAARWIGLALPRVLLRLPYGEKTDAIEQFAFEELSGPLRHDDYLWGNPALACVRSIASKWLDDGDDASHGSPIEIDELPAHVRDQDGERRLQPCAEHLLPIHVGEEMLRLGMTPLLSYGNRNAVRVMRVQSIADPAGMLAGLEP